MSRWLLIFAVAALSSSACGVVKNVRLRDDYDAVDKTKTVRLAVVTAPFTEGGEQTAKLYSSIARRYANHHRDFLAKTETSSAAAPNDAALCVEGIEGVLRLTPTLSRTLGSVNAAVDAQFYRCSDHEEIWSAQGEGSWSSEDPNVTDVIAQYVGELGEEVRPYVAPVFHLLRAVLEELPRPVLSDTDVIEKIELGE